VCGRRRSTPDKTLHVSPKKLPYLFLEFAVYFYKLIAKSGSLPSGSCLSSGRIFNVLVTEIFQREMEADRKES
jgi:hypothetical protein